MATSVSLTSVSQKTKDPQVRNVCMTLNNYSTVEYDNILNVSSKCKYLIVAKEVGESGTPHLQMYCEFPNPKTYAQIKKMFLSDRFHIETRRGTALQASDYCKKDDDFIEFGELSKQGSRTDWAQAVESLTNTNESIIEIIQAQPQLAPCVKALQVIRQLARCEPLQRDVKTIVLYGDAGTGKSFYANELSPDLYSKPNGEWWDGYCGENAVLLDDFYGGILYSEMLKVLDRYKLRVPVKGGFVGARWDTMYITSNKPPKEWYAKGMTPALERRITECYKLVKSGPHTEWYSDDLNGKLTYLHTKHSKTGEIITTPPPIDCTLSNEAITSPITSPTTPRVTPTTPRATYVPHPYEYKPICEIPDVKPSQRNPIIRKKILIPKPHITSRPPIHSLFQCDIPKIDLPTTSSGSRSCCDEFQEC